MAEALVFDALRTPRGKGKVNGSLHTTKPVDLVVGLMHEMLSRNDQLDPTAIDDVVRLEDVATVELGAEDYDSGVTCSGQRSSSSAAMGACSFAP